MALKIRTFYIDKGDQGPLQEATTEILSHIGLEGDFIEYMTLVSFSDSVLQLSIAFRDQYDETLLATYPPPNSLINTGANINHLSLLLPHPIDPNTVDTDTVTIDGSPATSIYLEGDYIIQATASNLNNSGVHQVILNSDKLRYTDGSTPRASERLVYNSHTQGGFFPGQNPIYTKGLGRRGEVVIEGIKLDKATVPSERLESYLLEIGVSQNNIISTAHIDLSPDLSYLAVAYFKTLEPQVIAAYPFNYSSPVSDAVPSEIVFVFKDPIDEHHLNNTDGVFYVVTSLGSSQPVLASDITVDQDLRTVRIATASYILAQGVYDFRVGRIYSKEGVPSTREYIYSLLVNDSAVVSDVTPGAGLYSSSPGTIDVGSADPTIVVGADDLRVGVIDSGNISAGAINTGHIASGQVVKSLNTLRDDINLVGAGRTTITAPDSSTISISGKSLTGLSGVEIDTSGGTDKLFVKGGDGTISVTAAGVTVGTINADNINPGQVVKQLNTLTDTVSIVSAGRASVSVSAPNIEISGKSITGLSGVEIDDSSDPTKLSVKSADGTISISAGGVSVGTIDAANINPGQVVKDLNGLKDSISLLQQGRVSISTAGSNIEISGKSLTGLSGVEIDDTSDPTKLFVKAADGTISISAGGVSVGSIDAGNINPGQVVKDLNGLNDSVSITTKGRNSVSVSAPNIEISGKSITGLSGVDIDDTTDPTRLFVKASDGTISISAGGVSVGTISAGNIGAGEVVKSLNTLKDDITLQGKGRTTISAGGSAIDISGKSLTGLSGVEIDDTTDPTKLFVKSADGTISISAGGVAVGTINGSNIAEGQVVKTIEGISPNSFDSDISIETKGFLSKFSSSISNTIGLSGKTVTGVSGVLGEDSGGNFQISVKPADGTIVVSAGGAAVGTIDGSNIAEGHVVKSIAGVPPNSTNSDIAIEAKGGVSVFSSTIANTLGLSGKTFTGVSGVAIAAGDPDNRISFVAADSTLEAVAAGARVKAGGIGSSHIANSTVVRSLNSQQDTVNIVKSDPITVSAGGGNITIGVSPADLGVIGVVSPDSGEFSIDSAGNLKIPSHIDFMKDFDSGTAKVDGDVMTWIDADKIWRPIAIPATDRVESLNSLSNTPISLTGDDPIQVSTDVPSSTITISVRDATATNTGVVMPKAGAYSIDASGNLSIPSELNHLTDVDISIEPEDYSLLRYNGSTSVWEPVTDMGFWVEGAANFSVSPTLTSLNLKAQGLETPYFTEMPIPIVRNCVLGDVVISAWTNTASPPQWELTAKTGSTETVVAYKKFDLSGANVVTVGAWDSGHNANLPAGTLLSLTCSGDSIDQLYIQVRLEMLARR